MEEVGRGCNTPENFSGWGGKEDSQSIEKGR